MPTENVVLDFYVLKVDLIWALFCTSLPVEEGIARLNREAPTGISPWVLNEEAETAVCSDNPSHTHYLATC